MAIVAQNMTILDFLLAPQAAYWVISAAPPARSCDTQTRRPGFLLELHVSSGTFSGDTPAALTNCFLDTRDRINRAVVRRRRRPAGNTRLG